jgi:outer membrane protein insertion porin family
MKNTILLKVILFLSFISTNVLAFTVDRIDVIGLENINKSIVLSAAGLQENGDIDKRAIDNAIKNIYKTGFFNDVQVSYDDKILTIKVTEKVVLSSIDLIGNDDSLKKDELDKIYDMSGVKVGFPISEGSIKKLEKNLKEVYSVRGYNSVSINAKSHELDKYRVNLKVNVKLGEKTTIDEIIIKGNAAFSESEIRDNMHLSSTGLFSWFTSDNFYSRSYLDMDKDAITRFYQENGYLDFNIISEKVEFIDNEQKVKIILNVHEGAEYKFAGFKITSTDEISTKDLDTLVSINTGDSLKRSKIFESVEKINKYLSDHGHANAHVNVTFEKSPQKDSLIVNFNILAGKVYHVRNIEFSGNYITDEIILRRSMSQYEGQTFSQDSLVKSERKLRNLSYVKDVRCSPKVIKDTMLVDINCNIEEAMSSVITGKIGYSDTEGAIYGLSYSQDNFLGTGNNVVFELNKTEVQSDFRVSHSWPYLTDNGISLTTSAYYKKTTPEKVNVSNYNTDNYGFNLGFGFPVAENHRLGSSLAFEHTELKTFSNTPTQITQYIANYGNEFNQLKLGLNWSYNNLDKFIFPTAGQKHFFNLDVALPYNDDSDTLSYYRISYSNSIYQPLFSISDLGQFIFLSNTTLGYGNGLGNQDDNLPWFRNFFAGGLGTVRGYASNSLGPVGTLPDGSAGNALGGNILIAQSFNFIIPQTINENLRLSLFIDAGNVFEDNIDWDDIRYSGGASIIWRTPMAPLVFSLGFPINKKATDREDRFSFSISVGS